jgi:hypothetical protein
MHTQNTARPHRMPGAVLALALAGGAAAGTAQAVVVYDFSGSTTNIAQYLAEPVAFRLTLPDVSTLAAADFPGITLDCSTLTDCINIGTVRFFSNFSGIDGFQLNPSNQNAGFAYFFNAGAYSSDGVYVSTGNPGILTVSGVASQPVPEPAIYALFAAGLLGLTCLKRRQVMG